MTVKRKKRFTLTTDSKQQLPIAENLLNRNFSPNASTERFFSSLKREWLTGNLYATREDAITDVRAYIAYYNSRRIHSTLGYVTPIEFEEYA
ncbi:IS3 family transposase [Microbulbifer sp. ZKSA006]|uniref:IS3 family transposase n=1 Tax=Microbulbifer sp. ZKSA006 TaxID=3243390 RepID=UPI004038FBD8